MSRQAAKVSKGRCGVVLTLDDSLFGHQLGTGDLLNRLGMPECLQAPNMIGMQEVSAGNSKPEGESVLKLYSGNIHLHRRVVPSHVSTGRHKTDVYITRQADTSPSRTAGPAVRRMKPDSRPGLRWAGQVNHGGRVPRASYPGLSTAG
jgi:hypothetical protein